MAKSRKSSLYDRVREILESARASVARSVNSTQVVANWLIGREIVEEEQRGRGRADYGEELLKKLSTQLRRSHGQGFSVSTLQYMRAFFQTYPALLEKQHALRVEFEPAPTESQEKEIQHALRDKSRPSNRSVVSSPIRHALRSELWQPGCLHPNLSWTHYRTLLRVESAEAELRAELEREVRRLPVTRSGVRPRRKPTKP